MATMKGAFMHGLDNMIIKEIPKPTAGKGNVVVSLEYVGICGSDVHYYHSGKCGAYEVDMSQDYMLGHETAGTVVEVGEGVTTLKVGDRVCLEPGISFLQPLRLQAATRSSSSSLQITASSFRRMSPRRKVR